MFRQIDSMDYDADFWEKVGHIKQSSPVVRKGKSRTAGNYFALKHFAGEVIYSTDGFIESNKDSDQKVYALLGLSQNLVLCG